MRGRRPLEACCPWRFRLKPRHRFITAGAFFAQQAGEFAAAEADLRAVLALAPVHAQALNALGFFLAERGERLEEAQRLVERALELAPEPRPFSTP